MTSLAFRSAPFPLMPPVGVWSDGDSMGGGDINTDDDSTAGEIVNDDDGDGPADTPG